MDLRDERGAVSPAEGCMFLAMILFSVLLIGLLVTAFFRFREPPQGAVQPISGASAVESRPTPGAWADPAFHRG